MFENIEETLEWIHNLLPHGMKPGTERVKWMLEQLSHPERRIRSIHVGGTNGKGSTVCYLRNVYQEAGYKVGTFTSPYITAFNERISVNGEGIADSDLIEATNAIQPLVDELAVSELGTPTEFEVITVISFYYFGFMNPCDLVIFEVGLGGRLDSTNVIYPIATVITSIGMDHTQQLGHTLEEIAFEKAGIIKSGVPLITGVTQEGAFSVIEKTARDKKAKIYNLGKDFTVKDERSSEGKESFSFHSYFTDLKDLQLQMLGEHQIHNAALALMVIDVLSYYFAITVEKEEIKHGLEKTLWPGRFEKISNNPLVILDGAHNPEGVYALKETIKRHYSDRAIHILYAALKDKDNTLMINTLEEVAETITFTSFDFKRSAFAQELYELSNHKKRSLNDHWQQALSKLKETTQADDVILVTGSLYFISEVRQNELN